MIKIVKTQYNNNKIKNKATKIDKIFHCFIFDIRKVFANFLLY